MALKYADYAAQQDNKAEQIDSEIQAAQEAQELRKEIPESVLKRFEGKSLEDVMESYANLEKEKSRLGEQVGKLRKTADQLLELQMQTQTKREEPHGSDTTESVEPLTVDELYENPEAAISRVVDKATKSRVEKLEQEIQATKIERAIAKLNSDYTDWQSEVKSDKFQEWVNGSAYRKRQFQAADQFDFEAANDLLEEWYSRKESAQEAQQQAVRQRQLAEAELETSSPVGVQSEQTFSRSELNERRVRAHQGSIKDRDWLHSNARAIALAYEEERITD